MPPHVAILDTLGDPADPIAISISGGQTSATTTLEIWNDKTAAFGDTTIAKDIRAKLLTASVIDTDPITYGPFSSYGEPITDERWGRFRITHFLDGATETTNGATATLPWGSNAEIPLPDLGPQQGVRVEIKFVSPTGQTANATKAKIAIYGNLASSPLAQLVALATGSGTIPGDRVDGLRAFLRGAAVTANDTATVTLERGQMVFDGTTVTFLQTTNTFTLADGDAVNLGADEAYLVTLSRANDGTVTVTKGPKAETVEYPALPADEILLAYLRVYSADGVAVTVAQADVDQSDIQYAQFLVRDGGGLAVTVSPGEGISGSDHRQYLASTPVSVALAASVTSRIWRLPDGSFADTVDDVPPQLGSDLLAYVDTDTDSVTDIRHARALIHRAITEERIELSYSAALSQVAVPAHALAWAVVPFDCEVESVELDLRATDGTWTAGALKIDIQTVAAGAAVAAGTTIFTSSATDDRRPSIAYNATNLRATSEDHEVRRFTKGMRVLLSLITTVAAPGAEPAQEIRAALVVRRYR